MKHRKLPPGANMASARLRKLSGRIFSGYYSIRRQSAVSIGSRNYASKPESVGVEAEKELDAPLRFTGSKAQALSARQNRLGGPDDVLWYQPYVVMASLSVFMIYFCILREENDIDLLFDQSLYDHVEGLEEKQIEIALEYNRQNGIDTKELEARLKEIRGQ